ncbi:MAG: response regulator [Solirubrobacteraceae bacterium]
MPAASPKVILVDNHTLFRTSLSGLLRQRHIAVVGEAMLGAEALNLAAEVQPDVAVVDLDLPGMSGIEVTHRLAASVPRVRVLVLTVIAEESAVVDALMAGARSYLLKEASIDQVVEAIHATARGDSMISPRIAAPLVGRLRDVPETGSPLESAHLTSREQEVLGLVARGLDNAEIAESLQLSQHTVKNHVSSILGKLQVENRIQAAVRAARGGLI